MEEPTNTLEDIQPEPGKLPARPEFESLPQLKRSKRKLLVVATLVAVVLLAGGGSALAYFHFKSPVKVSTSNTTSNQQTAAADPYAGWKTYDDSYTSFRYPTNWQVGTGFVKYTNVSVDVIPPSFPIKGMSTDTNPGAPVELSLHVSTDTLISCSSDYPCQVALMIPLSDVQLPHAALAILNQSSGDGSVHSLYEVISDNAKVGDTTFSAVRAGNDNLYIFGGPYYMPRTNPLTEPARLTDSTALQTDQNFKNLVKLINSITFK